ncbi:MAG: HAMP domain-containing histidine kinase [Myxococcales bacterium]|nr:HAMP domain-containing histidine kinase [Myxococcales bacterium]
MALPPALSAEEPLDAVRRDSVRRLAMVLGPLATPMAVVDAVQSAQAHDPFLAAAAAAYLVGGVVMMLVAWRVRFDLFVASSLVLVVGAVMLETPAGASHLVGVGSVYLVVLGHLVGRPDDRWRWLLAASAFFPTAVLLRQLYRPHPLLTDPLELVPQALSGAAGVFGIGWILLRLLEGFEAQVLRARAAERAKDRFLQNMSHELRTPLNAVVGYAELLHEEGFEDREAARGDLGHIVTASRSLLGIIDDLLDLARWDAGDRPLDAVRVSIRPLLDEVCAQIAFQVPVSLPDEDAAVVADPAALRRVLANLLGNAAKFTEQGAIRVEIERGDPLRIRVRDTGPGFDPAQAEQLFERFFQVDDSSTRRHGGSGLGLALCRRLVDGMGGRIHATSTTTGAVFTVELPTASDPC